MNTYSPSPAHSHLYNTSHTDLQKTKKISGIDGNLSIRECEKVFGNINQTHVVKPIPKINLPPWFPPLFGRVFFCILVLIRWFRRIHFTNFNLCERGREGEGRSEEVE
jgi:hypothetical protein